jgi:perosamine synthetase
MWSRKRLDIGWADLLTGVVRSCFPPNRRSAAEKVERLWGDARQSLACLSVRSGFDLLLGALDLPRGSEVLVSAVTIPDMVRIIEQHGLTPVPVDIDPVRMAPRSGDWGRLVTPATKAVLVAHLFGGRTDMAPIIELAKKHGLAVIEDCAQAFAGTSYQGCPQADASMFSFGVIKAGTALGGAVLQVRKPEILNKMRHAQAQWPVQSRWHYLRRMMKYSGMKLLSSRPTTGMVAWVCKVVGCDYDLWVNRAARGFPGDGFFKQIQRQPSAPLLAVLERRLRRYDAERWGRHAAKGRELARLLGPKVSCPGAMVEPHTYWVFPIISDAPKTLMELLARAGFDATQGQSLCAVHPPEDRPQLAPKAAEQLLAGVVFLPFYPELTETEVRRMADVVIAGVNHKLPVAAGEKDQDVLVCPGQAGMATGR